MPKGYPFVPETIHRYTSAYHQNPPDVFSSTLPDNPGKSSEKSPPHIAQNNSN